MKSAVVRAAQRELKLKMTRGSDPQICGSFYDVRVEGAYLGWTSSERKDELQKLYDDTPSLLRKKEVKPDIEGVADAIGIVAKRCRILEAESNIGQKRVNFQQELSVIRSQIDAAHERLLMMAQSQV